MVLLFISVGCFGLSNVNVDGFKMYGCVVMLERKRKEGLVIDVKRV